MHIYRKKSLQFLIFIMLVFSAVFVYALMQYNRGIPIFRIGAGHLLENLIVMGLSIVLILKTVYEIYQIEHHHEYEKRLNDFASRQAVKKEQKL